MAQRNTYREDEELEEQINFRDILRVGKYLKPYMAQVARILVVVISMSCIVVAVPYLTKIMIDAVDLYALPESQKKLRAYMFNYLSMMMAISSVFLTMDGRPEAFEKKTELWQYLKNHDERVYNKCRYSVAGACNLPGTLGHKITLWGYHVAQKIFKFN